MTQIDFYIVHDHRPESRYHTVCRLVEKAYKLGHCIHIHSESPQQAELLDELLWTYRQGSFIPHGIAPQDTDLCPVTISHQAEPKARCDVLVNLATDIPMFFSNFARVAEVINEEPAMKELGRRHYRFYRDRGYELHHHDLTNPASGVQFR